MRDEAKSFLSYTIVFVVCVLLFYYVFSGDLLSGLYYNESFRLILIYIKDEMIFFLAAFSVFYIAGILSRILSGCIVKRLSKALIVLGVVIIFQSILESSFVNPEIQALSGLILTTWILMLGFSTAYYISRDYNQRVLPSIIEAIALFTSAFLVFQFSPHFPFEYSSFVATAMAVGFVFAGVTTLFYPLRLSKTQALKKIGVWFSSSLKDKFLIGFFITLYLSLLRPYLSDLASEFFILGEWICVGLIAGISILWFRANLKTQMSNPISYQWMLNEDAPKKHKQEIQTESTEELNTLKVRIEKFLVEGNKKDILLFLTKMSVNKKLTIDVLCSVMEDLVDYQDVSKPRFSFLKEAELIKEENIERRKTVLGNTIEKLNKAYLEKI